MTNSKSSLTTRTAIAGFVALALAAAGVGSATATETPTEASSASNHRTAFTGTAYASESGENVDIAGTLHLVTTLLGTEETGWSLDWHTDLPNTTASGETTGDSYRATGTDAGTVQLPPGPPVRSASFEPTFRLVPPGPPVHPPSPIRLAITVHVGATGQVTEIVVQVDHGSFGSVD